MTEASQFGKKIECAAHANDGTPTIVDNMELIHSRAYYKGSSLPCLKEDETKFLQTAIKLGHDQIANMLRSKQTLKNIIALLTEQMDRLEEGLRMMEKKNGKKWQAMSYSEWMKYLSDASLGCLTGDQFMCCWWINIASLLELKAIENDEMNGWLLTQVWNKNKDIRKTA